MTVSATQKSTIDRPSLPRAPRPIRAAFRTLDRLAPGLAARWAFRLWFTVPRPGAAAQRPGPPGGEPFEVAVGGRRLAGQSWGSGPAVYLMHGWGGWATQLASFVPPLVAAGYRVVTFDGPSHGASAPGPSGPRRTNALELADALNAVVAAHGPARAVVGHSLGCIAVAIAIRDGLVAERAVFLAPAANPANYTDTFARIFGFGARTSARLVSMVERRFGVPMSCFDVPTIATQVATPPLLVFHDAHDPETRHADGAAIAASWPAAELVTTTGLGHRRIVRDAEVVARAMAFIGQRGEPTPT